MELTLFAPGQSEDDALAAWERGESFDSEHGRLDKTKSLALSPSLITIRCGPPPDGLWKAVFIRPCRA